MRLIKRKIIKRIKQDQVVMCYRDSKTNVLITWDCTPDSNIEVWYPDREQPDVIDIRDNLARAIQRAEAQDDPPTDFAGWWGALMGFFTAVVDHLLNPSDNNTIEEMEKEFEE